MEFALRFLAGEYACDDFLSNVMFCCELAKSVDQGLKGFPVLFACVISPYLYFIYIYIYIYISMGYLIRVLG